MSYLRSSYLGGEEYFMSNRTLTRPRAVGFCADHAGHLAVLDTEGKFSAYATFMTKSYPILIGMSCHVGAARNRSSRKWLYLKKL